MQFNVGDPVLVLDQGLAAMRAIMPADTPPNHYGAVASTDDDGTVMVMFPIGDDDPAEHCQVVPYDSRDVRPRSDVRPYDERLRAAAMAYCDDEDAS